MVLAGCTALRALPPGLEVYDLDIRDCTALRDCHEPTRLPRARLVAAGCVRLPALPAPQGEMDILDVCGCTALRHIPKRTRVAGYVEVADSGLTRLPSSLRRADLRWRGVRVDYRAIFRPERLRPEEVLGERNVEVRRVMLERFRFERLLGSVRAELLDADTDAGGRRELLRLRLEGDEDIVCVSVHCPSTGRRYFLRVPPTVTTCRQAVAWTAGIDDPDEYRPLVET